MAADRFAHAPGAPADRVQRLWAWTSTAWWPWVEPDVLARLLRRAAVLVVLGAVAGFATIAAGAALTDLDEQVLEAATVTGNERATGTARQVSHLAGFFPVAIAGAALALVARWRTGSWHLGQLLTVAVVGVLAVVGTVKLVIPRDRPEVAAFESFSSAFPSGHAARAVVVAGVLGWLIQRGRHGLPRVLVWVGATALALAIAGSRVALGMHWPTDVIAGGALGAGWLALVLTIGAEHPARAPGIGDGAGQGTRSSGAARAARMTP